MGCWKFVQYGRDASSTAFFLFYLFWIAGAISEAFSPGADGSGHIERHGVC